MGLLDHLSELGQSILTSDAQLKHQKEEIDRIIQQLRIMGEGLQDLRDRVVRLEAQREADRAQIMAEVAQFKTEVERAELRLSRQLPASQPIDEDNK
ncbi:MAG: hypothetical protein JO316_04890 [Abitibacteriaceae bacterium]|nr:hypothetical protein [Abditibacteriaceae bacterium]